MSVSLDLYFYKKLREYCEARRHDQGDHLLAGGALNYDEYRYMTGYIQALKDVMEEAESLQRRIVES